MLSQLVGKLEIPVEGILDMYILASFIINKNLRVEIKSGTVLHALQFQLGARA